MTGTTFTRATAEDAATVAALLARLAEELDAGGPSRTTAATVARLGTGKEALFHSLLARGSDGGAVGLALFFPHFSTLRGAPGVYVQDIWIDPSTRGQGLGEALLAAVARAAAADWDARYMMLTVYQTNAGARRFYDRLGFGADDGHCPMALDAAGFGRLAAAGGAS